MFPTPFRGMAIIGFLLAMSCSGAGLPIAIGLGLGGLCSGCQNQVLSNPRWSPRPSTPNSAPRSSMATGR
jgi:hypothetical protein